VTSQSEEQSVKQETPTISTVAGIEIDLNDGHCEYANSPIRDNFDPDSNVTSQSEEQWTKQQSPTM
jgi:hypothetical protein